MKKSHFITKLYFMLATLVGLFGTVIGFGVLIYNFLNYQIISNDAYISSRNYREIQQCSESKLQGEQSVKPTEQEVADCESKARQRLVDARYGEYIQMVLGGAVRGTLFLILFVTHYPLFRKATSEGK